jgi:hypothetical protein
MNFEDFQQLKCEAEFGKDPTNINAMSQNNSISSKN